MIVTIDVGNENSYDKNYFRYLAESDVEHFIYNGNTISTNNLKNVITCKGFDGIDIIRKFEVARLATEKNVNITPYSAIEIAKAEHAGKADVLFDYYGRKGFLKCKAHTEETFKDLEDKFKAKFRGRTPSILTEIADACDFFNMDEDILLKNFNINNIKALKESGISGIQVALLYYYMDEKQISLIAGNQEKCEIVSHLLAEGARKSEDNLIMAANWIANHGESDNEFLRKVATKTDQIDFTKEPTLEFVKTAIDSLKINKEVKRIEKAYKGAGFKLKNCKCLLEKTDTTEGKYRARILEGDDPMQVILGNYEYGGCSCCQKLGDAGESAMMYGLSNDHAGFFVITDKNTNAIKAEAETWQYDENTIVFDNIEFANDADIALYRDILKKWLENSPYDNIAAGCGYNSLLQGRYRDYFETAPDMVPPVTPEDLYLLSYEDDADPCFRDHHEATDEEWDKYMEIKSPEKAKKLMDKGEIDYYTYLYSDVDDGKGIKWLKHNGRIAEFFTADLTHDIEEINRYNEDDMDDYDEEEDFDEDYEEI